MKQLIFKDEARQKLLAGAKKAYDTVGITLGAKGQTVIIKNGDYLPIATKDGVTVIRYVDTEDKGEKVGLQLLQEAAMATNNVAGDGTTACTVMSYELLKRGVKALKDNNISPVFLKKGIDLALRDVITELNGLVIKDFSPKDIAKISANGDDVIASHIAEAFDLVGVDGIIDIKNSPTNETYIKREEGMRFDNGLISPVFINTANKNSAIFGECSVLLVDGDIMKADHIRYHVAAAAQRGLPLVLIANMTGKESIEMLGRLKIEGKLEAAVVKSPLYGTNRSLIMKDLAKLTGAKIIGDNYGNLVHLGATGTTNEERIKSAGKTHGTLKGFKSGLDSTLLIYEVDDKYIEKIKRNNDDFAKERVALLNSGMATIFVGGYSDVETQEKTHRVEDAVNATRAALSEGVVAGGGLALNKARYILKDKEYKSIAENIGKDILFETLGSTSKKILDNAQYGYSINVKKYPIGLDVTDGKEVNMIEQGIIDPLKVVKESLINSVSVVSTILSAGAVILD